MVVSRLTLAVAAALLTVVSAATLKCTEDEHSEYMKARLARPQKCQTQLDHFQVCDDKCYGAAQALVAVAPNCSYFSTSSYYEDATASLKACEEWRAGVNTKFRYRPVDGTGVADCNRTQVNDWLKSYDTRGAPAYDCAVDSYSFTPCTDKCVKLIEESVMKAPACPRMSEDYTHGERQKEWLLRCIKSRGESAASNAVMYTVRNGDGSYTRVTPPGSAPVGTSSTTSPVTVTDTQPTPTATPTSSAAQLGLPILTTMAVSIAVHAAV